MATSNKKVIGYVLLVLVLITLGEVVLGIIRPDFLVKYKLGISLLNWTFIWLTIVKAYYIIWYFMHLKDEVKQLKWSVLVPLMFLIPYAMFIFLVEAGYVSIMINQ